VLVIAQQRHRDFLLLRPGFLRERIVAADSVNGRVHAGVFAQAAAHIAHFCRADAREGHGKKEEERVGFSEVIAQLDLLRPFRRFGGEGKIGSFGANCECHKIFSGLGWSGEIKYRNGGDMVKRFREQKRAGATE
jgi:hypothetical protein